MTNPYPKIPLYERLYCAIDDEYCRRKYKIKNKARKAFSHNAYSTTHALAYHAGTLYAAVITLVLSFAFLGNSFASTSENLQVNTSLIYPVRKVSTLECRQSLIARNQLDESCKIALPLIKNANYDAYRSNQTYTNVYTTLWGDTYNGNRQNDKGDHDGVDIASSLGTPVYAIAHGVVTFAGMQAGYGNVVKLMFSYQGTTYHAVFAHLSVINVRKGEIVTQGQRIGAVGNSGNAFGMLGGYHLHFEISKDNYGRPYYSYTDCPALQTHSLTDITNNGLCRSYRESHTYDPIAFLELHQNNNPGPIPPSQSGPQEPQEDTGSISPSLPEIPSTEASVGSTPITLLPKDLTLRPVPASKLSAEAISFLREWDIKITTLSNNIMNQGQQGKITLQIAKKSNRQPFNGILPVSFSLISPNNGISLSQQNVQYINNGKALIDYTTSGFGYSSVSISIDGQTIAIMPVSIQ